MDGNLILGALAAQTVLIMWLLGLQLSNNNKLTKHCAIDEGKTKKLKILERMHGIDDDREPIKHPMVPANTKEG